jgi:hypothetical protein
MSDSELYYDHPESPPPTGARSPRPGDTFNIPIQPSSASSAAAPSHPSSTNNSPGPSPNSNSNSNSNSNPSNFNNSTQSNGPNGYHNHPHTPGISTSGFVGGGSGSGSGTASGSTSPGGIPRASVPQRSSTLGSPHEHDRRRSPPVGTPGPTISAARSEDLNHNQNHGPSGTRTPRDYMSAGGGGDQGQGYGQGYAQGQGQSPQRAMSPGIHPQATQGMQGQDFGEASKRDSMASSSSFQLSRANSQDSYSAAQSMSSATTLTSQSISGS